MFARKEERIIVVGAGQAGVQAVASLRAEGYRGAIVLVGEEPYPPYQRPPLSKAYLSGDFERARLFLKPESFFAESCELQLGLGVAAIDRRAKRVRFADDTTLPYSKLLLATGARPRRIDYPGKQFDGVHYLRGIDDVDALRPQLTKGAKLVVIGGGYIGLEVAAVAASHGVEVTIVEAADRLMPRTVSPLVSAFYEEVHTAHGVRVVVGAKADGLEDEGRVVAVHARGERIPADVVLIGVGVVPNSELAEEAGLACDNGIVVDEFARTSDPDIFAAGDCTNHPYFAGGRVRLESVQNAVDQAKIAALGMLGKQQAYREVPWFWSDQYDLKLQIAGLSRAGDATVLRGEPGMRKFAVFHFREGRIAAVEAINAAQDYIVGRKLIAAGKPVSAERLADPKVPIKSFG
jgi:3-phenylpropionate/trans-cinnamate dioxygenase ferredoxin reductase component